MREGYGGISALVQPLAILALLLMASCTTAGLVVERVKAASSGVLAVSELFICRGATHGAVQDRYGRTQALADAHKELCNAKGSDVQMINVE